jgi:hypothetical protein
MSPTRNDGMLESWNTAQKRITSVFESRFFDPWFVYPPATPADAVVLPTTSGKNNNVQIIDRVFKVNGGQVP